MRLAVVLAAGLTLAGCGTMTEQDVSAARLDQLRRHAIGTWISEPDGRNEDCSRRILEIKPGADLSRDDPRDIWLASYLTTSGTELPDARRMVRLQPMENGRVWVTQYRIIGAEMPTDIGPDETVHPIPTRFQPIRECDARLSGAGGRVTLSLCGKTGDAGDWLDSYSSTWSKAQMVTRVENFTGGGGPLSWGGCRFLHPYP